MYRKTFPGVIVNTAFTGAVADKSKNNNVPYTIDEIVKDAESCVAEGTSIGHFHVRDENGMPSCSEVLYGNLIEALRNSSGCGKVIICASTSGRHGQTVEQRSAVIRLPRDIRPDMASLTLSSMNFVTGPSINPPDTIRKLAQAMLENDVKPELEVFDTGMAEFANQLIKEGLLQPPYYFNILLGNVATAGVNPAHLSAILSDLPENSIVSLGGIGRYQLETNVLAIALADGFRIGLEDNLWMDSLRTPATNGSLTARSAEIARTALRPPMDIASVRKALSLPRS